MKESQKQVEYRNYCYTHTYTLTQYNYITKNIYYVTLCVQNISKFYMFIYQIRRPLRDKFLSVTFIVK